MRPRLPLLLFWLALLVLVPQVPAAEPKAATLEAFDRYVQASEQQMEGELRPGHSFLWIDSLGDKERAKKLAELRRGELLTRRLETSEDGRDFDVPDGLIHHWTSLAFLPGARISELLRVLQDYDHHAEIYAPRVRRSKLLYRDGETFHNFVQFYRKSLRTVSLNAEFDARFSEPGPHRAECRARSTRIAELAQADNPDSPELPPAKDHGYLWRMNNYFRMEEKDGGVYLQLITLALSRDLPRGLGWLLRPLIRRIARESLEEYLTATRRAVESHRSTPLARVILASLEKISRGNPPRAIDLPSSRARILSIFWG